MPWDFYLIFAAMAVLLPWRGYVRVQRLLAKPAVSTAERITLYLSTIAFQWFATAVVAWRAWARGLSWGAMGLHRGGLLGLIGGSVAGAALFAGFQWFNLRRVGKTDLPAVANLRKLAVRIFPQASVEMIPFLGLAATAGICEEFLYRGFAMAAFERIGLSWWLAILLSSLLFGLGHLYQGRGGLVSTFLLGLIFGGARTLLASLFPVMVWHIAIDVVAGIAGPRFLVKSESVE